MLDVARTLMYLSIFSGMVPLVFMLVYKERVKQRYFIWLGLLIASSLLTDLASLIGIKTRLIQSNAYLGNFYIIVQFVFLLLIYSEFYLKKKLIIGFIVLIYFGFEVINSIYIQPLSSFQNWSRVLSCVIFFGLAVGYFDYLFKSRKVADITNFAPNWINIAVLFYFGFSIYLFVMTEYVFTKTSVNTSIIFWGFHNLCNILKNCFFAVAIYVGDKTEIDDLNKNE